MNKENNKSGLAEFNATRDTHFGNLVGVGLIPSKSIFNNEIVNTLKIEGRLFEITFVKGVWYACVGMEQHCAQWDVIENPDACLLYTSDAADE